MNKKLLSVVLSLLVITVFVSCGNKSAKQPKNDMEKSSMQSKVDEYAVVPLTYDVKSLSEKEQQMLPVLIEIAQIMDDLFWEQTLGNKQAFLDSITDPATKRFAEINYGPWDRLDEAKPFIAGFGAKPEGANFYPLDMTKQEFEDLKDPNKASQYTILKRGDDGKLKVLWYHEAYKEKIEKAAELLLKAAELAEDPGLKNYFTLRSKALLSDNYFESDMAWMDMKTNKIDFVVGPIENYEDGIYGYKTAFESAILIKDMEWSKRLEKYSAMLPELQKQLPCDEKYKKEVPGTSSDLNAYDILYYAGDANSGGKTIAINLPNDEKVQLAKGSRRLQLKNAMKAKFDKILVPISDLLIDPSQRGNVKFDAFFANVMFHEVAHGLGIKNTITGKGTIREALKEQYSGWEEAKADILGLFLVTKLIEKGELKNITAEDAFVTYMAGLIRSVRFGATEAHGKANMMCFNFFEDNGAFTMNTDGSYKVDFVKTREAMNKWGAFILQIEGDGDYKQASEYIAVHGKVREGLAKDLEKLRDANIPKDVVFDQGLKVLGYQK